jgi:hypothetical protein
MISDSNMAAAAPAEPHSRIIRKRLGTPTIVPTIRELAIA